MLVTIRIYLFKTLYRFILEIIFVNNVNQIQLSNVLYKNKSRIKI